MNEIIVNEVQMVRKIKKCNTKGTITFTPLKEPDCFQFVNWLQQNNIKIDTIYTYPYAYKDLTFLEKPSVDILHPTITKKYGGFFTRIILHQIICTIKWDNIIIIHIHGQQMEYDGREI